MLERLEKFEAPPTPWHLFPGAIMVLIAIVACNIDYDSAKTDAAIIAESKARAEAPSGASTTLPLAYPLGCPEEDELGRPLKATLSIKGEKRPRCIYSAEVRYGHARR